jgi:outer membrane protein TolC
VQARALEELDTAVVRVRTALEQLTAAEELLRQHRAVEQTATRRFEAGAIARLDLLAVQLEALLAERAVLDARVAAHAAAGALETAVQSPFDLDRWLRVDAGFDARPPVPAPPKDSSR